LSIKCDNPYERRQKVKRSDPMELNIPAKIKWMELESRDEFPGQEGETGFCSEGQETLARGDRNRRDTHKNKSPF
jgi:hypothetical protein